MIIGFLVGMVLGIPLGVALTLRAMWKRGVLSEDNINDDALRAVMRAPAKLDGKVKAE